MKKRALIAKYLQDIRASYWFLPTLLALTAVICAQITLGLDHTLTLLPDSWRTTQVEGARAILALIAQAMIGVAGVMFSITIVAVSFASGKFGPRLIGNFMRDRGNQISLGILIATFVYSLLILRAVQGQLGTDASTTFVPHLSLLVALCLTAISVMSMIFYVHHIPEIINVSNISASLGKRLKTAALKTVIAQGREGGTHPTPAREADHSLHLPSSGYIQTWNTTRLRELAKDNDLILHVEQIAGDFISPATPVLRVWSGSALSEDTEKALQDCFALGPTPTEAQNPLFLVDQLVEMTARAMSPGVNDPFTAINCINWLYVTLTALATEAPKPDTPPQPRVKYQHLTFERILTASMGKIEPYVRGDALVAPHLDSILTRLHRETADADLRAEVKTLQDTIARETGAG
ncbi:DUF2254 domain-containing protein [Alphaproteobacteria bacterium KMM 3653]|uniref:DUF2254 domain-containing protein n=1 Tax=Harenicola maris TaxID=2841044 RepID=A0AAP2CMA9_9RHOB|nr:DUF2254 domain-containing protein [Harenicola maris]